MRAQCPNDPQHSQFHTTACVSQTWLVDKDGNFLDEVSNDDVVTGPDVNNVWTCSICGARAATFPSDPEAEVLNILAEAGRPLGGMDIKKELSRRLFTKDAIDVPLMLLSMIQRRVVVLTPDHKITKK